MNKHEGPLVVIEPDGTEHPFEKSSLADVPGSRGSWRGTFVMPRPLNLPGNLTVRLPSGHELGAVLINVTGPVPLIGHLEGNGSTLPD